MKEYKIELEEDKIYTDSMDNDASEIDLCLQVWQDLNRLSGTANLRPEDSLIKKILEQILEKEFNSIGEIPIPDFYTYHERNKEE
tara:strand:+ start:212 stop:466 length:255 start_codon:yes stop_codon:yes gene_type:complete